MPALIRGGLPLFVKAHDHHGSAVVADGPRLLQEPFLALLQRDGVDDALALHTLKSGQDDFPVRGVDHHGHPCDVGFGGDDIEEGGHLVGCIEQTVIHIDVDDQRTVGHLLAGNAHRFVVFLLVDQPQEFAGTRHVASFADIDEPHFLSDIEVFEAA